MERLNDFWPDNRLRLRSRVEIETEMRWEARQIAGPVGRTSVGRLKNLGAEGGRGRWCFNRIWFYALTAASLITFFSISGERRLASVVFSSKFELRSSSGTAGFRWEHGNEAIELLVSSLPLNSLLDEQSNFLPTSHSRLPTRSSIVSTALPTNLEAVISEENSSFYIDDVVALPDGLDLFMVRGFRNIAHSLIRISACNYGEGQKSKPRRIDSIHGRLSVLCPRPAGLQNPVKIRDISLDVEGLKGLSLLPRVEYLEPISFEKSLVFAIQSTKEDVILHAKNVFNIQRRKASEYLELENFQCVFGQSVKTNVTAAALGVYRCPHPGLNRQQLSTRQRVHLLYKGNQIPSIAYYKGPPGGISVPASVKRAHAKKRDIAKKHLVCSCTMVWNMGKFLKEWVMYNSHLGVSRFFLYDNNSNDDTEAVVSGLSQFNVTRRMWPWVKTQESSFSHCAIVAQRECSWILFTDVDEYLVPTRWLQLTDFANRATPKPGRTPLAALIHNQLVKAKSSHPNKKVGQISILCRNFGPTGLTSNPIDGVTQGYTCRDKKEQRHKSLVFFPALKKSLQNVIHHFHLQPNYVTVTLSTQQAVVNHYKFQVWSEFETKFVKRASYYVPNWKEPKNLKSKDRPEGVGIDGSKPPDWESSHCQVNDTALRDYTRRRFGQPEVGGRLKMAWER